MDRSSAHSTTTQAAYPAAYPSEYGLRALVTTSNWATFGSMFAAGILTYLVLSHLEVPMTAVYLLTAAVSVGTGIYLGTFLRVFLLRTVLWVFTRTFYSLHMTGRENVPKKGGALLVANHTSYVDALMIIASTRRHVRFIMYQGTYDSPFMRPLAKVMNVIPIAADLTPRDMMKSLKTATAALEAGEVVCIFAEGQITRTGQLLPFRKGFEHIVKGVDVPIIPVHLGNLWGSIFSFSGGRFFWKRPRHFRHAITVSYGAPMPSNSSATDVRRTIQEMGTAAFASKRYNLLHRTFAFRARTHPFSPIVVDGLTPEMSYFKTLTASLVLARELKRLLREEKMVGVLLPPSVGGALVNIALQWLGKVPVNLNYTASAEAIESACRQCGINKVISSLLFLEKAKVNSPRPLILLENLRSAITIGDRCAGFVWAACLPSVLIERLLGAPRGRSQNDLATVVFSSGSEGEPKGVMLTHRNIASNIEAALQVFPIDGDDAIMGILPFFHSMGFTAALWLPLVSGLRAIYHPNPLEARVIGGLIRKHNATLLMATSTLLQGFIRRCPPEHLGSIKYIVCGAEKLADRVREACKETFGIEPIEGYGATECSPLVALNVPNYRIPGFFQRGTKVGTVGHPLPGVSIRIVNPEDGTPAGAGESGMLLVEGPNVMQGYLGKEDKTAAVLRDGWYQTGDIASVDEDGFITITGRLSRFSKVGGEMVPNGKVEESLHELLGLTEQSLAVVSLPDEKRGEKLVVLHTLNDEQVDTLQEKLKHSSLPNLWIPDSREFHKVDAIPVLGSGKMDLRGLRRLAEEFEARPLERAC